MIQLQEQLIIKSQLGVDGYHKMMFVKKEDEPPVGGNASKLWVSGDLYPIDMDPTQRKGVKNGGKRTNRISFFK